MRGTPARNRKAGLSVKRRQANSRPIKEIHSISQPLSPLRDPAYEAAVRSFEVAIRHFHKQRYEVARELFEKLAASAPVGIADRAKVHLKLCNQRLGPPVRSLKGAEDYYVAGVSELNARRPEKAVEWLAKASKLRPDREEVLYALASAYALQGNVDAAMVPLKRSIELRRQNAFQAARDEDLRALASDPRFVELVRGGRFVTTRVRS